MIPAQDVYLDQLTLEQRAEVALIASPQEQLMADDIDICRSFAKRFAEEMGDTHKKSFML